jgi:argininosuccinate lyase
MTDKPWSGRFQEGVDKKVEAFTESVSIDHRLYRQDIEGSIAHARMLAAVGILTPKEAETIVQGLFSIRQDIDAGTFVFDPALEDVHMNIEVELTKRIGEAGKKIHTARSRNDQVSTDLRLYVRHVLTQILRLLRDFMKTIVDKASEHADTIIPGMTHLQFAQPVSFGHHLLAYFEMFLRDYQRIDDALERLNVSPLGSAALAGTPHPIDRFRTAKELGFASPCRNSMDGVSDRDFAIEAVFAVSLVMMHLSRLCEEIIIWNSQGYALVDLPDSYTTGSSIMPQKKNPDVAELVRGKTGRVYGNLVNLLTMMKGLPLTYNRDMQEDKLPVMDSLDTVSACVEVITGLIREMVINRQAAERALKKGFLTATDIVDYLAEKGVPFRDAHRLTGEIVASRIHQGKTIDDMTLLEFKAFSDKFGDDIFAYIHPSSAVDRRRSFGGTSRENVKAAIKEAYALLEDVGYEKV